MQSAVSPALLRNLKLHYNKLCLEEASFHQSQILIFMSKSALSGQYVYADIFSKCKTDAKKTILFKYEASFLIRKKPCVQPFFLIFEKLIYKYCIYIILMLPPLPPTLPRSSSLPLKLMTTYFSCSLLPVVLYIGLEPCGLFPIHLGAFMGVILVQLMFKQSWW